MIAEPSMPGRTPFIACFTYVGGDENESRADNAFFITERRPSPGLSLNLSSNNPFRNRAGSPAIPSPGLHTPNSAGSRPMSRNPFLSTFEAEFNKEAANSAQLIDMSATMKESPKKATFGASAEELFVRSSHALRLLLPT
jgi:hypothetical protein